jgi:hypothetical protein
MTSRTALAVLAALGAAALVSVSAAAGPAPYLRSAITQKRHVVVTFGLDELVPGRITVASRPATQLNGSFVAANIRIDEPLIPKPTAPGRYRARTKHTLPPGRYWVKISARALVLDCLPLKPCKFSWSNVRRVVVPRP